MEDVNISKYRAQVVRAGSTPASPGFVVSEGQNPVDPSGSGQNHLPVTIATAATGLSITESQVLGGAGTVGQYIRGDGSLADFPATTGGGSSVSYYLNGSVSQGTIGGVAYKELNRTPVFGTGTDISINADGYIASFITDALDPNKLLIPGGNWNFETYFSASSSGGSPSFYVELYKYNGTTFTLLATSSSSPELIAFGTNLNPYFSTLAVPETVLALTDRLAVRFYVTHSGRTITLHTEDNHLCQVITTFTTGLTALNGLTSQVQFFAVGTSGTDFAISSASDTHTFNLPTASATNRGALSSADWSTFNGKQNALTLTTTGTSGAATLIGSTLNIPQYQAAGTYVTAVTASSPLASSGGTTPNITIQQASGSQSGFLSSTDWTTFNSKQNALTNPVTGTGTTNYLPKFTGSTTIGNSLIFDNGTNVGIGTSSSTNGLLVINSTASNGVRFALESSGTMNGIVALGSNAISGLSTSDMALWTRGIMAFETGANGEKMRLTSGGNLLVGTTTDGGARLQILSTGIALNMATSNGQMANINSTNANGGYITWQTSGTTIADIGTAQQIFGAGGNEIFGINGRGARAIAFGTNDTERMRITTGGVVQVGQGVGNDAATRYLQIQGSGTTAAALELINYWNGTAYTAGVYGGKGSNAAATLLFKVGFFNGSGAAQRDAMFINESGNVGIGTNGPNQALVVSSGTDARVQIDSTSSQGLYFTKSGANNGTFRVNTDGDYEFFTKNVSQAVVIKAGGNVLIGTTTDNGAKLQVSGTSTFSDSATISKVKISSIAIGTISGLGSATVTIINARAGTIHLGAKIVITGFENQNNGAIMITANVIGNWASSSLNKYGIGTVVSNESLGNNDFRAYGQLTPTVGASGNNITLTLTNLQSSSITNVSVSIIENSN